MSGLSINIEGPLIGHFSLGASIGHDGRRGGCLVLVAGPQSVSVWKSP